MGHIKKLRIDLLDDAVWTFTHADIDGGNEVTETLAMADYPDRLFSYYSISNEEFIDREPAVETWDMVFTRFYGSTAFGPGVTAGVLTNTDVQTLVSDMPLPNVFFEDHPWVEGNISVIGNGYKFLNDMFQWEVTADQYYYVKLPSTGCVYEIVFTSFEGSATGNIEYNVTRANEVGIDENRLNIDLEVYPNPVQSNNVINISFEGLTGDFTLSIVDINGRLIKEEEISQSGIVFNHQIKLDGVSTGTYQLLIKSLDGFVQKRFIVE